MTKRTKLVLTGGIALLLIGGGIFYLADRTTNAPHFWAQAKATQSSVFCLPANDKLSVSQGERSGIEMAAVTYLIDVPAGTNVDVKLATYSSSKVTGTDYYPAQYGNYNFAMARQSDGWHITSFTHCH